ncbi:MAG: tRNA 4-thiouridine(8) synthase ThiI [Planctomycetota bacterium]
MDPAPRTAVSLFSGGLDSALAACLVKEQGVRVVAFHLVNAFGRMAADGGAHPGVRAGAKEAGVELHVENSTEDMIRMVRAPRYGFGKHLNPCIDCRMNTLLRAEAFRGEIGADFLVSGEVLGQRPMSQNRQALELIDRKTGLGEILLRPLSARLLAPTKPEREGWVERERLLAIRGRSRTEQLALARRYGLTKYGAPAGGCLLTDANFCRKLKALMAERPDFTAADIGLLRVGRHFRAPPASPGALPARIVSGRDHAENLLLELLAREGGLLFQAAAAPGSLVLLRPAEDPAHRQAAAGLAVYYSKLREEGHGDVEVRSPGQAPGAGAIERQVLRIEPSSLANLAE